MQTNPSCATNNTLFGSKKRRPQAPKGGNILATDRPIFEKLRRVMGYGSNRAGLTLFTVAKAAADTCVITVDGILDPSINLSLASIVVGAGAFFMDFMIPFFQLCARPAD
jgi:hypothetical protein